MELSRCSIVLMESFSDLSHQVRDDVQVLWDFHVVDGGPVTADLLLVLGSHDERVADRATELYVKDQAAPLIFISGGAGKVTGNEWTRPEAEVYAERMAKDGVPSDAIVVETSASNTGDNFEFSRKLLLAKGVHVRSGIVVSKPYMARRALAVGTKKWADCHWTARPPVISLIDYPTDEVPLRRMINLMVGDLQRLRVYAEKGFQSPIDIPADVWAAYERLANSGFDQFVIK